MNKGIELCCHSPTLSSLLYECFCCDSDQGGLLLGTIKRHVVTSITDDPQEQQETKTIIYIEHCVLLPVEFFRSLDGIDGDEMRKKWIEPYKKRLVGWFSSRRQYKPAKGSIRDHIIHQKMLQFIEREFREMFVLGLFSTVALYGRSTHSFHYAFHRLINSDYFVEVPIKIYNLSDRATNSSGYLGNSVFPEAESFQRISFSDSNLHRHAIDPLTKFHQDCNKSLEQMCGTLCELEKERVILEKEVKTLKGYIMPHQPVFGVVLNASSPTEEKFDHFIKYDQNKNYSMGAPVNIFAEDELVEECVTGGQEKEMEVEGSERKTPDSSHCETINSNLSNNLTEVPKSTVETDNECVEEPETGSKNDAIDVHYHTLYGMKVSSHHLSSVVSTHKSKSTSKKKH